MYSQLLLISIFSKGYIYYDDPENDKQKWKIHKDGSMLCFESVKWPEYYLTYYDRFYECCYGDPKGVTPSDRNCTEYQDDNWLNDLCTACNSKPGKICWKASIYEEKEIVSPRYQCDYFIFSTKINE